MRPRTLKELSQHVNAEIIGDETTEITGVATLEKAGPNDIAFLSNPKYSLQAEKTNAAAILTTRPINSAAAMLITENPYHGFAQIMSLFYGYREHNFTGIDPSAKIDESATIGNGAKIAANVTIRENCRLGENCVLYPGVYIGPDVEIGSECILYPHVMIYEKCKIGSRVTINANSAIGEDGFGYATENGKHYKIPQIGTVIIGDDVEIGACCGVERGTLNDTVVGEGTKMGDLVAIGHGSTLGKHCLLVTQVGIAGSTKVGDYVVIGGQAGVAGHLNIGNRVKIAGQAGVINDIPDDCEVIGAPAIDAAKARRAYSLIGELPQMKSRIKKINKHIDKKQRSE